MRDFQRGFIYCVTSADYGQIALASIHSLRQFHQEPLILYWGTHCWHKRPLAYEESLRFEIVPIQLVHYPKPPHKVYPHLVTKCIAWLHSPFEQTIFLDADTLVRRSLRELWTGGLTLAQFGMERRLGKPALLTGMAAFGKHRDIFMDTLKLAVSKGYGQQRAFQELYDERAVRIVGVEWNCPVAEHNRCPDPAVAHLDGGAWKGRGKYSPLLQRHVDAVSKL